MQDSFPNTLNMLTGAVSPMNKPPSHPTGKLLGRQAPRAYRELPNTFLRASLFNMNGQARSMILSEKRLQCEFCGDSNLSPIHSLSRIKDFSLQIKSINEEKLYATQETGFHINLINEKIAK